MRSLMICLSLVVCCIGCSPKETLSTEKKESGDPTAAESIIVETVSDDEASVSIVESTAKKYRRDGNGNLIDVDFRGGQPSAEAIEALVGLPYLRALRLGGTGVGDEVCEVMVWASITGLARIW